MRVRSMQMNDGPHLLHSRTSSRRSSLPSAACTSATSSCSASTSYVMRFSTHEPEDLGKKYVDEPELWVETEERVRRALANGGINHVEVRRGGGLSTAPRSTSRSGAPSAASSRSPPTRSTSRCRPRYGLVYTDAGGEQEDADLHPPRPAGDPRAHHRLPDRSITPGPSRPGSPRCRRWCCRSGRATPNTPRTWGPALAAAGVRAEVEWGQHPRLPHPRGARRRRSPTC